ncbi:MAG: universal stress protein [Paracoccaceae bacterium]|nr:universal stress protein [Paracoccaceae bacterium]MDE3122091.1 universal stress protein [Paracoccaceae bacterium]MDE3238496.1 universal stress protein [Paracoccaceae bacterium]
MAYKSIMTVLTGTETLEATLASATELARRNDAHLEVLSLGIDRTQAGYYYAGAAIVLQQEMLDRAEEDARNLDAKVQARLGREDIRWSSEAAIAQLGGLNGLVAVRARFNDLVVLPKPFGEGRGQEDEAVVEAALFEGGTPVLVVPDNGLGDNFAHRVVVAWNQSDESLRAVRAALPLLKRAEKVDIAVVEPARHGPERSDPGGPLSQMLARHGVRAEVSVLAKTLPKISDVLLRHVRDQDADMLVMGAYGHSRFREAILGGATRAMLEQASVPVLMAH